MPGHPPWKSRGWGTLADSFIDISPLATSHSSLIEADLARKEKSFYETDNVSDLKNDKKAYFVDNELIHTRYLFYGVSDELIENYVQNQALEICAYVQKDSGKMRRSSLAKPFIGPKMDRRVSLSEKRTYDRSNSESKESEINK